MSQTYINLLIRSVKDKNHMDLSGLLVKPALANLSAPQCVALLREAITCKNSEAFALLSNNFVIASKVDAQNLAILLAHAIKFAYDEDCNIITQLLGNEKLDISEKIKNTIKVLIKSIAFEPETSTELMRMLITNRDNFASVMVTQPEVLKVLLKQIKSDIADFDKQQFNLSKIRGVMRFIDSFDEKSVLQPFLNKILQALTADKLAALKTDKRFAQETALILLATMLGQDIDDLAGQFKLEKNAIAKARQILKQTEKNRAALQSTAEYYDKLVAAVSDPDFINDPKLVNLDRLLKDPQINKLADWQFNEILHLVITSRIPVVVLKKLLEEKHFQANAVSEVFRERVLCAAIETLNTDAIKALLAYDTVTDSIAVKGKNVVKMLIQAVAAEVVLAPVNDKLAHPDLTESFATTKILCENASFKQMLFKDELVDKGEVASIPGVIINELKKDKPVGAGFKMQAFSLMLDYFNKEKQDKIIENVLSGIEASIANVKKDLNKLTGTDAKAEETRTELGKDLHALIALSKAVEQIYPPEQSARKASGVSFKSGT